MDKGPRRPIPSIDPPPRRESTSQEPERDPPTGTEGENTSTSGASNDSEPTHGVDNDEAAIQNQLGSFGETDDTFNNGVKSDELRDRVHHPCEDNLANDIFQQDESAGCKNTGIRSEGDTVIPQGKTAANDEDALQDDQGEGSQPEPSKAKDNDDGARRSDSRDEEIPRSPKSESLKPVSEPSQASLTGVESHSVYSQEEHTQDHPSSYKMKVTTRPLSILLPRCPKHLDLGKDWCYSCSEALDAAVEGEDRSEATWKALNLTAPDLQMGHQPRQTPCDPKDRNDWHRKCLAILRRVVNSGEWLDLETKELDYRGDNYGDGADSGDQGPDNVSHEKWIPINESIASAM